MGQRCVPSATAGVHSNSGNGGKNKGSVGLDIFLSGVIG